MNDFKRNTGQHRFVLLGDRVLLCRPRHGTVAAILHCPSADLSEKAMTLVRHLVVRRKSLEDYEKAIVDEVVRNKELMDSIVEFPKPWFRFNPPRKTVRLLMAERGLHGKLRDGGKYAWIQQHMGLTYRVWYEQRPRHSFKTREEAIIVCDRINSGAPAFD